MDLGLSDSGGALCHYLLSMWGSCQGTPCLTLLCHTLCCATLLCSPHFCPRSFYLPLSSLFLFPSFFSLLFLLYGQPFLSLCTTGAPVESVQCAHPPGMP